MFKKYLETFMKHADQIEAQIDADFFDVSKISGADLDELLSEMIIEKSADKYRISDAVREYATSILEDSPAL